MDKIEIGAVAKPQGIKGELKIRLFCDGFDSVKKITRVDLDGEEFVVESFRFSGGEEAILKLKGFDDRNKAELYRGKQVNAYRSEIVVDEGRFFISDVLGCELFFTNGNKEGEIYDIVKGNVDYYYIKRDSGNAVFPLVNDVVVLFDIKNKRVVVDEKKYTEIVMYED